MLRELSSSSRICSFAFVQQGSAGMATQIIMDHSGDRRHDFNPQDAAALLKAEQRFDELMRGGYTAAVRSPTGDPTVIRKFDPAAQETLFFPRLVGG
jgi:hypothetical protein